MRATVSQQELIDALNHELEQNPECRGCRFSGPIFTLPEPDETGCNWDRDAVILTCVGDSVGKGQRIARRLVDAVARRYNLEG